MTLLIAGVLLWALLHLFPVVLAEPRKKVMSLYGEKPYKALFAMLILGSIAMMIFGWRSATPSLIYIPPVELRFPAMFVVVVAFIFIIASHFRRTRLRLLVRHPQLVAIFLWAFAHLMANGDSRSVTLFGGMLIWSLLSIILINRRDGVYEKPTDFMPVWREFIAPVAAIVISGQIVKYHYLIAGVALMSPK